MFADVRADAKLEDTSACNSGICEAAIHPCQLLPKGLEAGEEQTSPVCVSSCSASRDGLKYAFPQPTKVHEKRRSVREGGREGGERLEEDAVGMAFLGVKRLNGRGARRGGEREVEELASEKCGN